MLDNDVRFNPTGVDLGGSSGNLIEGNEADGSDGTGIAITGGQGNRVVGNSASNTKSDGIVIEGTPGGNVVEGNRTNGNLSDGIVAGAGTTLTGNAAHRNAGWGIQGAESTPDQPGVVDGGGNTADSQTAMENCIQKNENIDVVYTINEPSAVGAWTALKNAGKSQSGTTIVSVDGGCAGVRNVKSGVIDATSQQYPLKMAEMGVEAVSAFAKDGTKPQPEGGKDFIDTGVTLITDEPQDGVESEDTAYGLENCWG